MTSPDASPTPEPADPPTPDLAERMAAWFAPTPAEVVALVVLVVGSVAATLLWWYGSVAAPVDGPSAASAGTAAVPTVVPPGGPGGDADVPPGAPGGDGDVPAVGAGEAGGAGDAGGAGGAAVSAVTVHVSGAVSSPGLVLLPSGARVGDAVAVAGGLTPDADGARINLARVVGDGEQVHVPVRGEDPSAVPAPDAVAPDRAGASPGGADAQGRVDLNRAGARELEELPGIGPTRAAAIVAHREQHGPFTTPGDLRAVTGIGEATFQTLAPLVVVR